MKIHRAVLATLLFSTTPLVAQTLTMGNFMTPNAGDVTSGSVVTTDVDLSSPATATGNITSVSFHWASSGCTNGVKIKFFRRSGDSLTLTAERGPISVTTAAMTVAMSPAVAVQQGDVIGITRLTDCGNASTFFGTGEYAQFTSDVSGTVALSSGQRWTGLLSVNGTGTATESTVRVLPVVGSAPGSFGSFFRTGMQLYNPYPTAISGKLVFHRAGTNGSASDPSFAYSLAPGQVKAYPDVVAAMSQSGVGSMDVVVAAGALLPQIITRVYNDAGALGTTGLYEDALDVTSSVVLGNRVLKSDTTSYLVTPQDPLTTRMNIGVRALEFGARIEVRLRGPNGETLRSVTKTYAPNYFEQVTAEQFLGIAIGANQTIELFVDTGSAIVYGSSTDNITNDPAVQFAIAVSAIS